MLPLVIFVYYAQMHTIVGLQGTTYNWEWLSHSAD